MRPNYVQTSALVQTSGRPPTNAMRFNSIKFAMKILGLGFAIFILLVMVGDDKRMVVDEEI